MADSGYPKIFFGYIQSVTILYAAYLAYFLFSRDLDSTTNLIFYLFSTGKSLIVEAYRWVGDVMKQQLTGVKPVQMSELESEFDKVEGKSKAQRLLRSQQQFGGGGAGDDDGQGGEDGKGNGNILISRKK